MMGHERFSSRFGAEILDEIAGHRTLLVQPFLRGIADLIGGDGADAIRPAPDIIDTQSEVSAPPYQRASVA